MIVRAAWLYYGDGLTQAQVASRLFVSRQTVGRLLESARQHGIVRIEMDAQYLGALELANKVRDALGVGDAVVVPTATGRMSRERTNERIAAALAAYVRRFLHPGAIVGFGGGDSVARALAMLAEDSLDGVTVAAAAGSTASGTQVLANAPRILQRLRTVPAPLVVSSASVAEALSSEAAVSEVFDLARRAVVTLTGIGSAVGDPSAVRAGIATAEEVAEAVSKGAVGDMIGEWFDIHGRIIDMPTTARRVGLSIREFRGLPNVVAVAAGAHKVDAIRGAVAGGYIKTLVTDEPTAELLLGRKG
ncbi:MAG TPA: MarR family transcriptional regulator [Tessaracoccus flavescens]|uniref:MarR family transcriptional regulator n=1 Tax=Tessaracoccus flavescens TaxID=399497 RepID=A0A921JRD1_9ACTN|nr:MarR family transcriptional regulator [Tessaracoccus flavescens]